MFVRRAVPIVLALALALVAGPAGAATAPQVTDACGDAGSRGEWNGDSQDIEETKPYLDIASGHVAGLYDESGAFAGFTAAITVCGEVSATEGGYNIGWSYGDRCYTNVTWTLAARQRPGDEGISGAFHATSGPRAMVSEDCYREPESPLDSGVDNIYTADLPAEALVFDGATLTFTVPLSALPEAAAPRFAPGTEWSNIGVTAMDQGPSLWAGYVDTEGNRGQLTVRTDFAFGGASYVVGEDAGA